MNKKEQAMTPSLIMSRVVRAGFGVAVLCGVVACATGPTRSDAQRQLDKETAARVQSALDADKQLYAKHIFVRAENGVVSLTGYVWTQPDLLEAEFVAGGVPGVSKVLNDLELQRNGIDDSGVSR
ncbi:MAG: BON domain-containing protein [Steroidobacteraceae bacterium]